MTLKTRPIDDQSAAAEHLPCATCNKKSYYNYKKKSVPCANCGKKCYPDAKYNFSKEKKYCSKLECKMEFKQNPALKKEDGTGYY